MRGQGGYSRGGGTLLAPCTPSGEQAHTNQPHQHWCVCKDILKTLCGSIVMCCAPAHALHGRRPSGGSSGLDVFLSGMAVSWSSFTSPACSLPHAPLGPLHACLMAWWQCQELQGAGRTCTGGTIQSTAVMGVVYLPSAWWAG